MSREIDDLDKRRKYKQEVFGGKKSTTDDYTGGRVFAGNRKDALRKHPSATTSDTDHITPIDVVKGRYGDLTEEQQRAIANNSKHNYATVNSKLNRSKGQLENHDYLIRQAKKGTPENASTTVRMLAKEVDSRLVMKAEGTVYRIENSLDAGKIAVMSKSFNVMTKAAAQIESGEKEAAEAIVDAAKEVTVYTGQYVATDVIRKELVGDASEIISRINPRLYQELLKKSVKISEAIAMTALVADSFSKLIKDEISSDEFIVEVSCAGITYLASQIGIAIGGPVGSIAASLACSLVTESVICIHRDYKSIAKEQSIYLSRLNVIADEMIQGLHEQRTALKQLVEAEQLVWNTTADEGLDLIFSGAVSNDLDSISSGLDKILNLFGSETPFKNTDDVRTFMDQPDRVFTL